MRLYQFATMGTALLFVFLFAQLVFTPIAFVEGLGLEATATTSILCRRAAMFMIGLAALLFGARRLQHSQARQTISFSTALVMTGLACMSSIELIRGTVNSSIWIAIVIETLSTVLFWISFFTNIKTKNS